MVALAGLMPDADVPKRNANPIFQRAAPQPRGANVDARPGAAYGPRMFAMLQAINTTTTTRCGGPWGFDVR